MDVLYFIREEYAAVKTSIPLLVGGDTECLQDQNLRSFLKQVELLVRIADDLVLPELADSARKGLEALAEAGDQTTELAKIVTSGMKAGRLGDARKRELATRLTTHLEHMEQVVLPRFRGEISTQTREDMGLVAMDFKADMLPSAGLTGESAAQVG